jgi:hypothetical protein
LAATQSAGPRLLPIRGTATAPGTGTITVEITDGSNPPHVGQGDITIKAVPLLQLTTTSLPEGLEGLPYDFTPTAVGGEPPYTWNVLNLPNGLSSDRNTGRISGTPLQEFFGQVSVFVVESSRPRQSDGKNLPLNITGLLNISTSLLPELSLNVPVSLLLATRGGTPPFTWSLVSGRMPAGLTFNPVSASISGTPTLSESQTFTLQLTDSGTLFPQSVQRQLTLSVVNSPRRNDTPATATPLSNGTYRATISPMDDGSGGFLPDNDYYVLTANPGAVVSIEITADRLLPPSRLDSVIEIVDANGVRFNTCNVTALYGFGMSCMNDDIQSASPTRDSKLYFQAPGAPGDPPVTFYVRVLDWRGMARPDFAYTITISGAN